MAKFGKIVALALSASAAAMVPSVGSAAPYFDFTPTGDSTFGNDGVGAGPLRMNPFDDLFTFTLNFARTLTFSDVYSERTSNTDNINFSFRRVRIVSGSVVKPSTVNDVKVYDTESTGDVEYRTINSDGSSPIALAAGTYTIEVFGTSQADGTYNGTLSLAGVPEPATWAMMIGGFGLVGSSMRRRVSKVAFA